MHIEPVGLVQEEHGSWGPCVYALEVRTAEEGVFGPVFLKLVFGGMVVHRNAQYRPLAVPP